MPIIQQLVTLLPEVQKEIAFTECFAQGPNARGNIQVLRDGRTGVANEVLQAPCGQ